MRTTFSRVIELHELAYDVPGVIRVYPSWPVILVHPARHPTTQRTLIDKNHALTGLSATAYFIAFGPHGPRRPPPPDEGRKVLFLSTAVIFGAFAVFAFTRMFASPIRPRTMTKEWQEATEEYMKVRSFTAALAAYFDIVCVLTHVTGPGH